MNARNAPYFDFHIKMAVFVFETPELQEQMDSVFSYFQKRHAEKGQEALCELCENWQRNAFVVGFQTAVNLLTE